MLFYYLPFLYILCLALYLALSHVGHVTPSVISFPFSLALLVGSSTSLSGHENFSSGPKKMLALSKGSLARGQAVQVKPKCCCSSLVALWASHSVFLTLGFLIYNKEHAKEAH